MGQWTPLQTFEPRASVSKSCRIFGHPFLWLNVCLPVSNQFTDLPNSRLMATSTGNRRHDPESHLPRGLAGIFSLTLVSIKLLLEASLGILDRQQSS